MSAVFSSPKPRAICVIMNYLRRELNGKHNIEVNLSEFIVTLPYINGFQGYNLLIGLFVRITAEPVILYKSTKFTTVHSLRSKRSCTNEEHFPRSKSFFCILAARNWGESKKVGVGGNGWEALRSYRSAIFERFLFPYAGYTVHFIPNLCCFRLLVNAFH